MPYIQALRSQSVNQIFNLTPEIDKAFRIQDTVCCIDGGIIEGFHLAGSGVLLSQNDVAKIVAEQKMQVFTTHDGCGAFAKAFPDAINPDEEACEWGKRVAKSLGISHRHIRYAEMSRPADFHNEIVAYYDGTSMFNRVEGLPSGFVISRFNKDIAQHDLRLALQIAFGANGFGDMFGAENPFHIIPIMDPSNTALSLEVLELEVREIAKLFPVEKVSIAGVQMPQLL